MQMKSLYIQVRENRFHVRSIGDSRSYQRRADPAFSHPRMLIGDFTAAQDCLASLLAETLGPGAALPTQVIIHPLETIEGGLTQVEELLFHELAIGAGASRALVWVGAPLTGAEVTAKLEGRHALRSPPP